VSQNIELLIAIVVLAGAVWLGWRFSGTLKRSRTNRHPTGDTSILDATEASDEADIQRSLVAFQKIVHTYGAVLEQAARLGNTVPQSLLPCDKEMIKAALKTCILVEANSGVVESMKVAYISLATFVADEDARTAAQVTTALGSGDPEALLRVDEKDIKAWSEMERRVLSEMERLSDELDLFMSEHR
jgi:hypothetical protein